MDRDARVARLVGAAARAIHTDPAGIGGLLVALFYHRDSWDSVLEQINNGEH